LIEGNLAFEVFSDERDETDRLTAALLDRFTHRCHIFEMNGESYRFRESAKTIKNKKAKTVEGNATVKSL